MDISNIKKIQLIGTSGLNSTNKVIVYNTSTFSNSLIYEEMGFTSVSAATLTIEPTLDTIDSIKGLLENNLYYPYLEKNSSGVFIYNGEVGSKKVNSGQGYNVILCYSDDLFLGYIILTRAEGVSDSSSVRSVKKRGIYIKYVAKTSEIDLSGLTNSVNENTEVICLNDLLASTVKTIDGYATKSELGNISGSANYGKNIKTAKDTITSFSIYTRSLSSPVHSRIYYKNTSLGSVNYDNYQLGYYGSYPVCFCWIDSTNSILIKNIRTGATLSSTTTNLSDETYIDYFTNNYAITKDHLIFDIQNNEYVKSINENGLFKYYQGGAEVNKPTSLSNIKFYDSLSVVSDSSNICGVAQRDNCTYFLINEWIPNDRPIRLSSWNLKELIQKYPWVTSLFSSISDLFSNDYYPFLCIGDWIEFRNNKTNTRILSNLNKTITFTVDPVTDKYINGKPIIINNQTVLQINSSNIVYINGVSTGETVWDGTFLCTALEKYRRNYLPETQNIEIIGALWGTIFYIDKDLNIISYL